MKSWHLLLGALALAGAVAYLMFSGSGPGQDLAASDPAADPRPAAAEGLAAGAGAALEGEGRRTAAADAAATGAGFGRWVGEGAESATVTARLVAAGGRAATDSEMRLRDSGPQFNPFLGAPLPDAPEEPEAQEPEPVTADAQGLVHVAVPVGRALDLEFGGPYWRSQQRRLDALRSGEVADLGEIALVPAARLSGVVLDPTGRPVAGATASLRAAEAGMFWEGHAMLQEQVADAEGRVRFDGVPVGRFRLEAQARGFAPAVLEAIEVREAPGDATFELRLAAGRALRGRVVDADRRPVADAEIHLLHLGEGAAFWGDHVPAVPDEEPDARSGPDGGFTLRGLPDPTAQCMILAKAEGYGVGHLTRPEPDLEATLVLPPALAVSGRVLGGGDQPVAGAEVHLTRKTDWGWDETVASAETAADGTFQLDGVEPGSVTLSASAQGATSEPLPLDLQRPLADLTLRVAPRPALRVRVVGDAGQPLSGAIVDLSSAAQPPIEAPQLEGVQIAHGFHGGWSGTERTGADGVATFHGAPEGELTIGARCAEWARNSVTYGHRGGDAETTVTLGRPAALLVRVVDGAGAPVRGVGVRLRDPATGKETEERKSDALGRALWTDLAAGTCEILHGAGDPMHSLGYSGDLVFSFDGGEQPAASHSAGETVALIAGECAEKEIQLRELAVANVRVLRGGAPAVDVAVRLERVQEDEAVHWSGMDGGGGGARTDGRGMVTLDPVAAGRYRVLARPARNSPDTLLETDLLPGRQEIVVNLNGAEVRGVVRSATGPVVGARVSLEPWSSEAGGEVGGRHVTVIAMGSSDGAMAIEFGSPDGTTASTDGGGEYVFRDVPEGHWVVRARADGLSPTESLPFQVSGDRLQRLPELNLLAGGIIEGRDLNWKPAEASGTFTFEWDRSLRLEREDGSLVAMTMPKEGGQYKMENLSEGRYLLRRGEWSSEPIALRPGEIVRVDVPVEKPKPEVE